MKYLPLLLLLPGLAYAIGTTVSVINPNGTVTTITRINAGYMKAYTVLEPDGRVRTVIPNQIIYPPDYGKEYDADDWDW